MDTSRIHIGTSGWYYEHWNEVFYEKDTKPLERLAYYSSTFSTVEINSTFYHLPKDTTVKNWISKVPKHFIFSLKASQYITHRKRLNDPQESLEKFNAILKQFHHKLGPVLFQLPPSFSQNKERLLNFIKELDTSYRYVFEFRHPTWYSDDIYKILKKNKIALCITDLNGHLSPEKTTSDFTYIRLHGPQKAYRGSYPKTQLNEWKEKILNWASKKMDVYCYFDNDEKAYAVKDAINLIELVEDESYAKQ